MRHGDYTHNFAADWRGFREQECLSQPQLAEKIGCSVRTVQGVESGAHRPNFTNRLRFMALVRARDEREELRRRVRGEEA